MQRGAIIIGGSGGIGSAVTRQLAEDGFDVCITYRSNLGSAENTARQVTDAGGSARLQQVLLEDDDSVKFAVDDMARRLPSVDAVIYAAGPYLPQLHISRLEPQAYADQLLQDAAGAYSVAHWALPHLRESKGAFVSVSTPAVQRHVPKDLLSSAPKAAIEALVRGLAVEEGRFGVRANCVGVGVVTAGMHHTLVERGEFNDAVLEAANKSIPLRRFGAAEDVAHAVSFLVSDKAGWISGQTLYVDGGWSA